MNLEQGADGKFLREVTEGEITIWVAEYHAGMTFKQIGDKYGKD